MEIKIQKELDKKSTMILEKTTEAFSELEKEYNIERICFSGIHANQKGIDWVTQSSYKSLN